MLQRGGSNDMELTTMERGDGSKAVQMRGRDGSKAVQVKMKANPMLKRREAGSDLGGFLERQEAP